MSLQGDEYQTNGQMTLELDINGVEKLAADLAATVSRGDTICLQGDLGAGKTTFARAFIRSLLNDGGASDIPSPSFALVQSYEVPRFTISHFDFYRLGAPEEVLELGLDEAVTDGIALIEWPEKAEDYLPDEVLLIRLDETASEDVRQLTFATTGAWGGRLERFQAINVFLDGAGWGEAKREFLQGDASPRKYTRLNNGQTDAILMDAPRQPDGPPVRDGKPYSAISHLAEDVYPFYAIGNALKNNGIHTPEIYAHDLAKGLLLLEDLGDGVFGKEIAKGTEIGPLYSQAVDVLVALRKTPPAEELPIENGKTYRMPLYNEEALGIEVELLIDWYWPAIKGGEMPEDIKAEYLSLWSQQIEKMAAVNTSWVLRDFHSPNLILLDESKANGMRTGVIDFQDAQRGHAAYDLVSLLQDARLDVPADTEAALLDYYCGQCRDDEGAIPFDEAEFREGYAVLGAQRNSKLLGIFARLAKRDGKTGYLAHIPRIWDYLERNLEHENLSDLKTWFETHFPKEMRSQDIRI